LAVHHSLTDRFVSAEERREWQHGLPELTDGTIVLRELVARDAPALLTHLNQPRVLRYIAPCPTTVDGFHRFIRWTHTERRRGLHVCYGIIPPGQTAPVGIIQIWPIDLDFSTAEWGFALGASHWGTGLFMRSARVFLDAAFGLFGAFRLEARSVDANGRGNGVLHKLGATREGVLRAGFRDGDDVSDHLMWSILAAEWPALSSASRDAS
jgi:RimJ/RimL family protein N-acetyltransferase